MSSSVRSAVAKLLSRSGGWYPLARLIGIPVGGSEHRLRIVQVQTRRPKQVEGNAEAISDEGYTAKAALDDINEEVGVAIRRQKAKEEIARAGRGEVSPPELPKAFEHLDLNPFSGPLAFWLGIAYLTPDWNKEQLHLNRELRATLLRVV